MKLQLEINGTACTLNIPMDISEPTFNQFISFRAAEQEYFKSVKPEDETEPDDDIVFDNLLKAVCCLVSGDVAALPISCGEDLESMFDSGYQIHINDEISLMSIYVHLVNLLNSYEPENLPDDYSVEVEGERFYICPKRTKSIFTEKAYTVGEVIELKEYQRAVDGKVKSVGDPEGNLAFTLGLAEMAILLRKQGEALPMVQKERDAFLKQRMKLFKHLSMKTVLDVRFFLLTILRKSAKNLITNSFLKVANRHTLEIQRTKPHGQKQDSGPKKKQKKNGT